MGYSLGSYEGSIESWGTASNLYEDMLSSIVVHGATLDIGSKMIEEQGDGASALVHAAGIREWSVTVDAHLGAASPLVLGNAGFVSFGANYTALLRSWNLAASTTSIANTVGNNTTPPTYRTFRPGLFQWSGGFECFVDSATALTLPHTVGTSPATITLKYDENTLDGTFSGSALINQLGVRRTRGQLQTAAYSFVGSGALSNAGTRVLLSTSPLSAFPWSEGGSAIGPIVFATKTGDRTFTGDDSFLESLRVTCSVDSTDPVAVQLTIRGSGALVSA